MKPLPGNSTSEIKYFIVMTGLVLLLIPSCLVVRYDRKADDGSTSLTNADSLAILPFAISECNTDRIYRSPEDVKFQVIDACQVNEIVSRQRYSWIVVGASWCGVSKMSLTKFPQIIRCFPPDSIRLIVISQDFNIPSLQKELFDAQISSVPYLLSSVEYGTDEVHKQERFAKDLHWDLPLKPFKGGGVPMNIIIDNRKQVYYLFGGIRVTADSITKYTGLAQKK
jgi:hypothetical protein